MPIKGLTDQPKQFKEIGQLRKGAPKPKDQQRPGADLTYFRATFEEGEDKAVAMFHDAYGDEPREINIRLPFDTVEENFDAWQEAYVQSGLIHRCDGEYVQYEIDPRTGEVLVMDGLDANGEQVKCDGSADCKPTGRLKVIIPELRRLAFMTVLTTSVWDILNISRQLEAIRYMNGGKLQRVPLVLTRRPREISTPSGKGGKKARREKWLLGIEADPDWVEAQILKLPAIEEPLRLPPGVPDTNGDEDEIIEAEAEELPFADKPEEEPGQANDDAPVNIEDFYEQAEAKLGVAKPDAVQIINAFLEAEHGGGANIKSYVKMAGSADAANYFWHILKESLEPQQEEFPF
jgi:hypothetical protein